MSTAIDTTSPYGSWISPITSTLVADHTVRLTGVRLSGNHAYWLEARPREQGRHVIAERPLAGGKTRDVIRPPFSARSRVNEYGGGAWLIVDGTIYFSNDQITKGKRDSRLYRQRLDGKPVALVPEGKWRYADGTIDRARELWIGVREDHSHADAGHPSAAIVAIAIDGSGRDPGTKLVSGHDFYSSPRLSPDGRGLVFLAWNHPHMPWDETSLFFCELGGDGKLNGSPAKVAGGSGESVFQPEWLPDGSGIIFATDRSGWWNLCIFDVASRQSRALTQMEAEFGRAQWQFGMSTYAFAGRDRIVATYTAGGLDRLAIVHLDSGRIENLELPFTEFHSICANGEQALFCAGAFDKPTSVVLLNLRTRQFEILKKTTDVFDDESIGRYLSKPKPIEFPTTDGTTAFGYYYPPANPDYVAPEHEVPPLRVRCHGGPTSAASTVLSPAIQFWTSRGIAVLDVNYGGSTGYGRAYRNRLHCKWGIVDVDDAVAGAEFLAGRGLVDPRRMVISGSSAGGYTTLATLAFRDTFQAGASHFGISDLAALTHETHKFEARYLEWLVGPYPQAKSVYEERSPLRHVDRFSKPVIFFQGEDDPIVVPSQTETIVNALRSRGVTVGYFSFSGERHGFEKSATIERSLDAEFYFYAFTVFGTRVNF